ncbi:MAG: ABC transporter ATP-binding protein [Bdellovibrionales bacterium]
MTSPSPTLEIKNVSVSYDTVNNVISDISLNTDAGEFFGLIGLNGAGKTTLIKAILGLRSQSEGEISIFGQECTHATSKQNLAFLPERFEPPWFLTGLEFLHFSLKLYGEKGSDELFYEYAEKLALDKNALKRRVQTYSKGMRQKLGLLGTVLTNCKLLILDEPMSGLDPRARTLVKDMLMNLKSEGRTIFLSSHILADMDEICDKVAVLHDGKIQFTGKPAELKKQTKSENLERAFLHFIEKPKAA